MSPNVSPKTVIPLGTRATSPLPPNVPTGPKAKSRLFRPVRFIPPPPAPTSSPTGPQQLQHPIPAPPSPFSILEKKIAEKLASGQYLRLTKLPAPFPPWGQLFFQRDQETRPCHGFFSIVHKLSCGHTVIDAGYTASSCAPNCVNFYSQLNDMYPDIISVMDEKVHQVGERVCIEAGWNVEGLMYPGMPVPQVDPSAGDFACVECDSAGNRASDPAFVEMGSGGVVVVVRGNDDREVIAELEKLKGAGVVKAEVDMGAEDCQKEMEGVPKAPRAMIVARARGRGGFGLRARASMAFGLRGKGSMGLGLRGVGVIGRGRGVVRGRGGLRGRGVILRGRGVVRGRGAIRGRGGISKARLEEKESVLGRLREEDLIKGLEGMMREEGEPEGEPEGELEVKKEEVEPEMKEEDVEMGEA